MAVSLAPQGRDLVKSVSKSVASRVSSVARDTVSGALEQVSLRVVEARGGQGERKKWGKRDGRSGYMDGGKKKGSEVV